MKTTDKRYAMRRPGAGTGRMLPAACLLALCLGACSREAEEGPRLTGRNIQVNMQAYDASQLASGNGTLGAEPTLFFFNETQYQQVAPATPTEATPSLKEGDYTYLVHVPEDVDTYSSNLYDTGLKYKENEILYAAGYAPAGMLIPKDDDHATLKVDYGEELDFLKGSIDFLSCDADPAYRGSFASPFGQSSNVLKFRHLTSKVSFYAYRSADMQGKQHVRHVMIGGLKMKYNGEEFQALHAPSEFRWSAKEIGTAVGDAQKQHWGYTKTEAEPCGTLYLMQNNSDGLLVGEERATWLSSLYVCDPTGHTPGDGDRLVLQLGYVSAELSFNADFQGVIEEKVWRDMTVEIREVKDNTTTGTPVRNFAPGHEYRVYLRFGPTGVSLQGTRVPWNEEGPHYVPITPVTP